MKNFFAFARTMAALVLMASLFLARTTAWSAPVELPKDSGLQPAENGAFTQQAVVNAGVFGSPDWRPPASWKLPKVCGKDFWTLLCYPRNPNIYDEYAPFVPGDEPRNFAIFRETGDYVTCGLNTYLEHHAKEPGVPCYAVGIRYGEGMQFLSPELGLGLNAAANRLRHDKQSAEPEYAIDGNTSTGWAFPKILPQWLVCTFPAKTTIDRIRFFPSCYGKPVWRFFIEVSSDGENLDYGRGQAPERRADYGRKWNGTAIHPGGGEVRAADHHVDGSNRLLRLRGGGVSGSNEGSLYGCGGECQHLRSLANELEGHTSVREEDRKLLPGFLHR